MKKLIALIGYKGSGKDETAKILKELGFQRVAFADVLKDETARAYNIPREWMDDPEKKETALPQYPVKPQDETSEYLNKYFATEYRTLQGKQMYVSRPRYLDGDLYHTPRSLLILEGSVKRSVSASHWVNKVLEKIQSTDGDFVLTDMRYRSEVEQIQSFCNANQIKFIFGRINREPPKSSDPSERDLDTVTPNFTIENKGTLEDLKNAVEKVVCEFLPKKDPVEVTPQGLNENLN